MSDFAAAEKKSLVEAIRGSAGWETIDNLLGDVISGAVSIRIGGSWVRPCEPDRHGVAANEAAASLIIDGLCRKGRQA